MATRQLGVCRIQTFRHLEATTWLLSGLSWTGRRSCVMVTENHAHGETCVFAVVFISVWRGRSCQCAEKWHVPALASAEEERMFGLFFPHLWILPHWSRQCFCRCTFSVLLFQIIVRVFVNALCVIQADTSSFPFYSFSNLKDNNRQHHLPIRVVKFRRREYWWHLRPRPSRQDEDYLTGHVVSSLSGPASGLVPGWTKNIESAQRREATEESETRLDVEPVFPAGGVHGQRLPVHWQGKPCTPTSCCDFS